MPSPAVLALVPALLVPLLLAAFPATVWPAVICYHAYCLGVGVALESREHAHAPDGARHPAWLALAAIVVVLAAGELMALGIIDVAAWLPAGWPSVVRRADPWAPFAAYSIVANGYVEERFWRGALLPRTGILAGGLAFGLMHGTAAAVLVGWDSALPITGVTIAAGLVWGVMRTRYDALWPCVLTHVAVDAAILRVASALTM